MPTIGPLVQSGHRDGACRVSHGLRPVNCAYNAPVFLVVPFIGATALFDKVSEDIQDRGIARSRLLQGPSLGDVGNPAILLVRSTFW